MNNIVEKIDTDDFREHFASKGIYLHLDSESYRLLKAENLTSEEEYMNHLGRDTNERLIHIASYFRQGILVKGFYKKIY